MAFREDDIAAKLEGYEPLDLHKSGDFSFALKSHHVEVDVSGCSPGEVAEQVLQSPRLRKAVLEVAAESGHEVKEVQTEAQALLDEIAHKMALPAVRTLALGLRMVLRRVLHGVYVNTDGLDNLRKLAKERPVVLLPSHRSYLDFILVTFIMFNFNIKLPCIAAGQDFMNMKGVSGFLRRSGAFFLRRTFGSDKLYKTVFSVYVQTLLCRGDFPMEFFIEGTRSRTAKMLHPKLGLLSMVVEPYLDGRLSDIYLVPISISYERTLEEELFARELLGVPKPKESTGALFKARSILSEDYGSIYTHISSPISLHEFCLRRGISRVPHVMYPKDMSVSLSSERDAVLELGHKIIDHTHNGMRVFPSSLVATIVMQCRDGISLEELVRRVEWLRAEILARGGTVHWITDSRGVVESGLKMLSVALTVDSDNLVKVRSGLPHEHAHTRPQQRPSLKEVNLIQLPSEELDLLKQEAFFHLLLAHYRNQLLHLFVTEAMMALSLCWNISDGRDTSVTPIDTGTVLRRLETLHCALACEFVLPLKTPRQIFDECLRAFVDRGLIEPLTVLDSSSPQRIVVTTHGEEQLAFSGGLLLPFVVGNWVVCEHLLSLSGGVQSLSGTVSGAQQLAAKCLLAGLIDCHEALSLGIVKNCLASLTQAGLILQPISEFSTGRDRLVKVAHQDKLAKLTHTLGLILFPREQKLSKL